MRFASRGSSVWVLLVAALAVGGCGSLSGGVRPDLFAAGLPEPDRTQVSEEASHGSADREDAQFGLRPADYAGVLLASTEPLAVPVDVLIAQAQPAPGSAAPRSQADSDFESEEYDPWERFNQSVFTFNRQADRFVLKPVAKAWNFVLPDVVIDMLDNGFRNFATGPRLANQLLQGRFRAAGIETTRFLINSTIGIAGLFDVARQSFNLPPQRADFGQTLGSWGAPPGPFLMLPLLPPSTVRDAIGMGIDSLLDPISWLIPFIWERLVLRIVETINTRALNLELFQGFEETTIDFYTSVRNAYLQRREQMVREAIEDSVWNLKTKEQLR